MKDLNIYIYIYKRIYIDRGIFDKVIETYK